MGATDPRTLSREEFDNSPDRLFHGSKKPFNFSPTLDYNDPNEELGDGSWTLGPGFYCTDNIEYAGHYSAERQVARGREVPTHVTTFLPYQARMLDLRSRDDPEENAHFPRDLALQWRDRFARFLEEEPVTQTGMLGDVLREINQDYLPFLDSVISHDDLDIRSMLETSPGYHNDTHRSRILLSPPGQDLFARFMREQGFDGLIYREGGEGPHMGAGPSFVFYNTSKIGTYESWHGQQGSAQQSLDETAVLAAARYVAGGLINPKE